MVSAFIQNKALQQEIGADKLFNQGAYERFIDQLIYTIWLLTQLKEPDQKFKGYVDILPQDVSEFPCMYTQEDLSFLENSNFLE